MGQNNVTGAVVQLSPTETANEIRAALKAAFPGVKFGVRTSKYSGGSSIRVTYERGPASDKVSRIADRFQGRDFDGMTDSSSYRGSMLLVAADGTVREVRCSGSFVFVNRDHDDATYQACEAAIVARYAEGHAPAPHLLRVHGPMGATDWPEGATLAEFAARVADAYFA